MNKSTNPLVIKKFEFSNIPDLTDKVVIVTGANKGLGYITSRELARKNATLIMACRNVEEGEKVREQFIQSIPPAQIEVLSLDLASLDSIKSFVSKFKSNYKNLDVLVNNAGATARVKLTPEAKTTEGFEYFFGVNHLGTFALTGLLFNVLSGNARIVTVSSLSHKQGKIHFDNLNTQRSKMALYGQSKLANLLFSYELARKIEKYNLQIKSIAVHPGFARTTPRNDSFFVRLGRKLIAQSADKGSLPLLYASTMSDVQNGDYIGPSGFYGIKGYPKRVKSSKSSYNEEDAKRLWNISEESTKIRFSL